MRCFRVKIFATALTVSELGSRPTRAIAFWTMRTFANVQELKAAVGEKFGPTEWRTVTQEQVNLFAEATNDHQWIHVDVERAKEGRSAARSRTAI
jgi:hypothetical protein